MAGIRHHILPRFLLKGFASRIEGKKVFTWVYTRNGKYYEASTKDVSVEKFFYGKENNLNVDDEITNLERKYALFLDELRFKPDRSAINDIRVTEFITHLCIRTKHFRDSLRESSEFLIEKLKDYLSDFNNIKKLFMNDPEFENSIKDAMNASSIPKTIKEQLSPLLPYLVFKYLEQNKEEVLMISNTFFQMLKKNLSRLLREGHIKALLKGLIPEPRFEVYKSLRWYLCYSPIPLILGNMGCLFETTGAKKYKILTDKNDEIINVFLPISSFQILVGTNLSCLPQIDFETVNYAFARNSREYFICAKPLPEMISLAANIGLDAEIISKNELTEIINQSVYMGSN